ncbi:MAG: SCP2 sterol-binding domain-containing protein [Proteobacteria bacterium]|nr:SCP2 sterol-binding domain-containing protein [Pseudomonadota bacterium]
MATGPVSIPEALDLVRKRFCPEAARDTTVVYGFDLSGEGGGQFSLQIDGGRLLISRDPATRADVVFRLSACDYFSVLAGEQNPDILFMEDRLIIEGDLSLALKIRTLFARTA